MPDILRFSLEDPPRALRHGEGLQRWRMRVRKSGEGGDPTLRVEVYEGNRLAATALPETAIGSEMVLEGTWDARHLNGRGEAVEANLEALRGSGGATVELASFLWISSVLDTPTTLLDKGLSPRWTIHSKAGDNLVLRWGVESFLLPPEGRAFVVYSPLREFAKSSSPRQYSSDSPQRSFTPANTSRVFS